MLLELQAHSSSPLLACYSLEALSLLTPVALKALLSLTLLAPGASARSPTRSLCPCSALHSSSWSPTGPILNSFAAAGSHPAHLSLTAALTEIPSPFTCSAHWRSDPWLPGKTLGVSRDRGMVAGEKTRREQRCPPPHLQCK